jgi:hypothetical protein
VKPKDDKQLDLGDGANKKAADTAQPPNGDWSERL